MVSVSDDGGFGGVAAPLGTEPRAPEAANPLKKDGGFGGVAAARRYDQGAPEAANPPKSNDRPVGIFDSGVGGLTVLDSIMKLLPQENLIYFGDTARFPYGPRPIEEVRRFAFEIIDFMASQDVKVLVIACNSMTAAAYREATQILEVPVIGVIEPAVRAAIRATHNRKIGVLGTQATIASGEYERALAATRHNVQIFTQVCAAFVDRVEAGDTFSDELFKLAEEYLGPLLASDVDTLILGCTHYPLLTGVLHSVTKGLVELISSAEEVAKDLYTELVKRSLLRRAHEVGTRRFIVSGDPVQFHAVGSRFLAGLDNVEHIPVPAGAGGVAAAQTYDSGAPEGANPPNQPAVNA